MGSSAGGICPIPGEVLSHDSSCILPGPTQMLVYTKAKSNILFPLRFDNLTPSWAHSASVIVLSLD
jgi:hypothetical protein